jgi:protein pelota
MRVLKIDRKENFLRVVPEIEDDLWHLERVIEEHDLVTGLTDRKIKGREAGEKAKRIKIVVTLDVEGAEFHRFIGELRVSGKIVEGTPAELLDFGSRQSLEIGLGKEVKIKKQSLKNFQVERIRKAAEATKKGKVLLLVLDDEQACFAWLKEFELQELAVVRSNRSGKQFKGEEVEGNYYRELLDKVLELKPEKVVVAGPGFAKESFEKFLKEKGFPKEMLLFFASTNSVGKTGFQELLKGDSLSKMVQEMQLVKETRLVERLLAEIGKGSGLAEYGLKEVEKAVEAGAVSELLVEDKFLLENRQKTEEIMQKTEKRGGVVHLINGEHEAGRHLSNLGGGVAALLRYRVSPG